MQNLMLQIPTGKLGELKCQLFKYYHIMTSRTPTSSIFLVLSLKKVNCGPRVLLLYLSGLNMMEGMKDTFLHDFILI